VTIKITESSRRALVRALSMPDADLPIPTEVRRVVDVELAQFDRKLRMEALEGSNFDEVVSRRTKNPQDPIEADGVWPVLTGTSAKGWRMVRAPGRMTYSNDVDYAPYARKRGEPVGNGVRQVERYIEGEIDGLAEGLGDAIAEVLNNG
jgi:hypothetical protein